MIQEKSIHRIFLISLIVKGVNSVLEIFGGLLFLFAGTLGDILSSLIQNEIIEDPNDFFANHVLNSLPHISVASQIFAAYYLLSHGIIKIFLVISLLRNKQWAYPLTIAVLALFIVYQLFRYSYTHSLMLMALTVFDILLLYLTAHEYRRVKKHLPLE